MSVSLYFSNKLGKASLSFLWTPGTEQVWKDRSTLLDFPATTQPTAVSWKTLEKSKYLVVWFGFEFVFMDFKYFFATYLILLHSQEDVKFYDIFSACNIEVTHLYYDL